MAWLARSTIAVAMFGVTSCSLIFDGSDLRGRRDAEPADGIVRPDAPPGCDMDGDGYLSPECAGSDAPDCDDTDAQTFPWPPRSAVVMQSASGFPDAADLDVVARDAGCGVAGFLIGNQASSISVVLTPIGDSISSCQPSITYAPGSIPCGIGLMMTSINAVDFRSSGSSLLLTVAGRCAEAEELIHTIEIGPETADEWSPPAAVLDVELFSTTADPAHGVLWRDAIYDVSAVYGGGFVALGSSTDRGMQTRESFGIVREGGDMLVAFDGTDTSIMLRTFDGLAGRATLVNITDNPLFAVLVPTQDTVDTWAGLVGPFGTVAQFGMATQQTALWTPGVIDPLFDSAYLGDERFLVVGRTTPTQLQVRVGRFTSPLALDPGALGLEPADMGGIEDVAIAAAPPGPDRIAVYVAAIGSDRLLSARFSICYLP